MICYTDYSSVSVFYSLLYNQSLWSAILTIVASLCFIRSCITSLKICYTDYSSVSVFYSLLCKQSSWSTILTIVTTLCNQFLELNISYICESDNTTNLSIFQSPKFVVCGSETQFIWLNNSIGRLICSQKYQKHNWENKFCTKKKNDLIKYILFEGGIRYWTCRGTIIIYGDWAFLAQQNKL